MRWLADPASFEPPRPARARRRTRILLLGLLLATLVLVAAGLLSRDRTVSPSPAEVAVAPQSAQSQQQPQEQAQQPAPPLAPTEALAADDEPPPQASVPTLTSDDRNLSFARRAGLHRVANPLQLTASVAYAVDASSGEVLYARNDLAILPVASLTKLVMAMVVLDSGASLNERITIADADIDRQRHSRSRLAVGTQLTRATALRLALMSSENRAAHALGRTYPGGRDAFVQRMNLKARELGAVHATFVDPTGLSNANQATAQDVALIVAAASKYQPIRQYSTTARYSGRFGNRQLTYLNSNRLVRHDQWPITLQKTGYIVEAGQCLALMTKIAGRSVIVVLLDAGSFAHRIDDARKLRQWLAKRGAPGR